MAALASRGNHFHLDPGVKGRHVRHVIVCQILGDDIHRIVLAGLVAIFFQRLSS
jgi:hypothetical protein